MLAAILFHACVEFGACTAVPVPVTAAPPLAQVQVQEQLSSPVVAPAPPLAATTGGPSPIPMPADLTTRPPGSTYLVGVDTDGWATYSDGVTLCVTGAACQVPSGYEAKNYTYNWDTGTPHETVSIFPR